MKKKRLNVYEEANKLFRSYERAFAKAEKKRGKKK
jgi:hypothetical protein